MSTRNERHAQKARTREVILAGARALLARGEKVTVTAAADESGVSKATAYRYFSDAEALVLEAGLAIEVAKYEEITANADGPQARALAVTLYFFDLAVEHEPAFRRFVARTLTAAAESPDGRYPRAARRLAMFERALSGAGLSGEVQAQLKRALSAVTGIEALIALRDVAGADHDTARRTVRATAEALLDRYLSGTGG